LAKLSYPFIDSLEYFCVPPLLVTKRAEKIKTLKFYISVTIFTWLKVLNILQVITKKATKPNTTSCLPPNQAARQSKAKHYTFLHLEENLKPSDLIFISSSCLTDMDGRCHCWILL